MRWLLLLLILLPTMARAENRYGLAIGLDLPSEGESLSGKVLGLFLDREFTETQIFALQLRYHDRGIKSAPMVDGRPVEVTNTYSFLELAAQFKYKFNPGAKFRPSLYAGPSVGRKLNNAARTSYRGDSGQLGGDVFRPATRPVNLAAELGAELEYTGWGDFHPCAGLTYSHGLVSLGETTPAVTEGMLFYLGFSL